MKEDSQYSEEQIAANHLRRRIWDFFEALRIDRDTSVDQMSYEAMKSKVAELDYSFKTSAWYWANWWVPEHAHWALQSFWKPEEAALLLIDRDPKLLEQSPQFLQGNPSAPGECRLHRYQTSVLSNRPEKKFRGDDLKPNWEPEFVDDLPVRGRKIFETLQRDIGVDEAAIRKPGGIIAWAESKRFTVPKSLREAVGEFEPSANSDVNRLQQELELAKQQIRDLERGVDFDEHSRDYPPELHIAYLAWSAVASDGNSGSEAPKARLEKWLIDQYPDLSDNKAKLARLSTVANWDKRPGRKSHDHLKSI